MDLQSVAQRCELPIRLVRYVVDHRILPGSPGVPIKNQRGQPRIFTESEALDVAIASHLLHAGLKRATVVNVMKQLAKTTTINCVMTVSSSATIAIKVDLAAIRKQLFSL